MSSGAVQEYHGVAGGTKDTCRENEDDHLAQAASARHIADEEE
ncbi:hypothetical protein [Anaplasma phagocytophilum]|uniref:Uncharacterized protein n=1 Tax=Anaplasma phagocytophilum TaxID=948 RepID=A0A098EEZ1_ANAPH|nr:hypothetical protein [Anaplasma phagocytophilum]CEG20365.1 Uncharacterized protein ANAPHAGO_00214 [Anaplasma phagocytophilum]